MRFIHLADVHLGMQPDIKRDWSQARSKEIWKTFENVINQCEEESVDLLLIAGDLFHKQPLLRELKEVNYLFKRLTKTHVVMMAGNHDYIGQTSNYINFPWAENVHMFEQEELATYYIEEINTRIYGLSYLTRDIAEAKYHQSVLLNPREISILLAHGGDEKNIPIDRKTIVRLGYTYVALGHIHKPTKFSNQMAYAGSLEPLDKTETGEHGYIQGDISRYGDEFHTDITFIPCSTRQYISLVIEVQPQMTQLEVMDMICEQIRSRGMNHIYSIVLEGARDVDVSFDVDEIVTLGYIVDVEDFTIPDYDFDELRIENRNNIIGMYIDKIRSLEYDDEVIDKALYLGVKALMKQNQR
ncbi:metallophosphoesterase family protein [Anaerosporobacter sp.]|uniref:metallophosphoesterase family protein n=1 Tax=Anaerosporobacter sp. TaxID=1872529 RepID=UPI00286F37E6|nr:exonuclease SbcCD subunit D [Anaerosporobacter sp.]